MNKARTWASIALAAIVVIALVALLAVFGSPKQTILPAPGDDAAGAQPTNNEQAMAAARSQRAPCGYQVGQETALTLALRTEMEISPAALGSAGAAEQRIASITDATVTIRGLQRLPGDEVILALRMTDVRSAVNGQLVREPSVIKAFAHAFLLHVSSLCKVRRFARHRDVPPRAASLMQTVADVLDIQLPGVDAKPYEAYHDDQYGNFLATYGRSQKAGAAGTWTRRRSSYRATTEAMSDSGLTIRAAGARAEFVPAAGLGLASARIDGAIVVSQGGRRLLVDRSKHKVSQTRPVPGVFEHADLDVSHYIWGRLEPNQMKPISPNAEITKLVGVPLDKAWPQFTKLRAGPNGHMEAVKYLSAWLKANPDGATQLKQRIMGGAFDEVERSMIVHAMSLAGTPQARAALLDMSESGELDYKTRTQAVAALGDLVNPNEDTIRRLAALARGEGAPSKVGFVQGAATLAIGSLLGESRHADSAVTKAAREEIKQLLGSDDAQRVKQALGAIGNAGDPLFLDAAQAKLSDKEPRTRVAAIRALRLMDADKVQPVFTKVLQTEPDPDVIAALAWAHAGQITEKKAVVSPAQMSSYARRLKSVQSVSARRAIIEVLGKMSASNAAARRLLATWFWKEPSNDLKGVIGKFVSAPLLNQAKP